MPNRTNAVPAMPHRTIVTAKTLAGRTATFEVNPGYKTFGFRFPAMSPPRVARWYAASAAWYQAVPDLVQNDPSTPFEALWEWLSLRAPLRWHPDGDDDGTFDELQVDDMEQLNALIRVAGDPRVSGPNPVFDINFDALEYVP